MEKILTSYLYQYKSCPLPPLGTLLLHPGLAQVLPGQQKILAPVPFIEFSSKEMPPDNLHAFIADHENSNIKEAALFLQNYCNRILKLKVNEQLPLAAAGYFYKDDEEQLHFTSAVLPAAFVPYVAAERVIHPDVAHTILVGDRETNSAAMSEILNTEEEIKPYRWWLAAVWLSVVAVVIIFFYSINNYKYSFFGSSKSINATEARKSYQIPGK